MTDVCPERRELLLIGDDNLVTSIVDSDRMRERKIMCACNRCTFLYTHLCRCDYTFRDVCDFLLTDTEIKKNQRLSHRSIQIEFRLHRGSPLDTGSVERLHHLVILSGIPGEAVETREDHEVDFPVPDVGQHFMNCFALANLLRCCFTFIGI